MQRLKHQKQIINLTVIMGKVRDIRLAEDQKKITQLAARYPFLKITQVKGNPAYQYLLVFQLLGYVNAKGDLAQLHPLLVTFPEKYPFAAPPKFTFLKGLFHPNVYQNGDVCHGWYLNNWTPAIRVDDLLMDIMKMICFKKDSYNLASPANYDCDRDWIARHRIPADYINLNLGYMDTLPKNMPVPEKITKQREVPDFKSQPTANEPPKGDFSASGLHSVSFKGIKVKIKK